LTTVYSLLINDENTSFYLDIFLCAEIIIYVVGIKPSRDGNQCI